VDDRVTGIVPLSEKGISEVYIDIGEPRLVPLPLMGAGFFNALNITAAILSVGNGIALVDEIEDGIHYLAFPPLARALIQIASQTDAQLFITTHSGEIIDAFADAAKALSFPDIVALHFARIKREPDRDAIRLKRYGEDDLRSAREVDLELR